MSNYNHLMTQLLMTLAFLSLSLGFGQTRTIYIYYALEDLYPSPIQFILNEEQLTCGALYDPTPSILEDNSPLSEISYTSLAQIKSCTNPEPYPAPTQLGDPVVSLGTDESGNVIYGWIVVISFYGNGRDVGTQRIYNLLKSHKLVMKETTGLWGSFDFQVSEYLFNPSQPISLSQIPWQQLDDTFRALFYEEPLWENCTVDGYDWCHRAYWGLPLHLRVHGNEIPGNYSLSVELSEIAAGTEPLSLHEGKIEKIILIESVGTPAEPPPSPPSSKLYR